MIRSKVYEPSPGQKFLQVLDSDEHGPIYREIPLAMIASRRELWGIDDPVECVEAILHVMRRGEPEPDPVTGENVYTEAYQLLRLREQAREDEAAKAKDDRCSRDAVVERSEKAAYDAVHTPVDGGECAMDRCRREARRRLGLPEPARKCGAESRTKRPPVPAKQPRQLQAMRPAGGKAEVLDLLAGQGDELHACTRQFLHSLTDHEDDPLDGQPTAKPTIATAEQVLAKYQGGRI